MKIHSKNIENPQNSQNAGGGWFLANTKKAFTLVEVVITVIIIWILATISYISFSGYTGEAKDTARVEDLKTISKLLEYELSLWKDIPEPEGVFETKTIDWIEFNVGTFSWQEIKNYFKSKASVIPEDPKLDGTKYIYALDTSGKKYILKAVLESGEDYYLANFIDNEGILASHKNKKWENLIWVLPKTTGLNLPDVTTPSNKAIENVRYTSNEVVVPANQIQSSVGSNGLYVMSDWKIWWTPSDFIWKENEKQRIVYVSIILWNETENKRVSIAVTVLRDRDGDGTPDIEDNDQENTGNQNSNNWNNNINPSNPSNPNRFDSECLEYREIAREVTISWLKVSCDTPDIVIPESINGKPVTGIDKEAFEDSWLKSVVFPNSLKYIWARAFKNNDLTSVNATGLLVVGKEAFVWNQITSVNIPKVTTIGYRSFFYMEITWEFNLPEVKSIWWDAFFWSKFTKIYIPKVKTIWDGALVWTELTSIELPEVEIIWRRPFSSNQITSINISKVKIIWEGAFSWGKITWELNLPEVTSIWESAFKWNQLTSVKLAKVTSIWNEAFYWNQITWELNLLEVENIWWGAFKWNQITRINIPEVTTIWENAFYWNQLTNIELPKVKTIWIRAFWENNLTKVVLPTWVKINDSFSSDLTIEYK